MPLVAHNDLPTFEHLRARGLPVLGAAQSTGGDRRRLHIGLLNMMPDAALMATERQFMGLVGASDLDAGIFIYPFTLRELNRGADAGAHVARHYFDFDALRERGLDALIITGANVANPALEEEPFWKPLVAVADWAGEQVPTVLCSCLATHALLQHFHGIRRRRLPSKCWGVFPHTARDEAHPIMRDVGGRFDAPHSRYNDVPATQLEAAGVRVLAASEAAGVHLAVSADGFRRVYFQGHPEYDAHSLLKEYKREVRRCLDGERDWPHCPANYLGPEARRIVLEFRRRVEDGPPRPDFPDEALEALVANTWGDTGKVLVNNWLTLIDSRPG